MSELIRYESEDGCEHCLHFFTTNDDTQPVLLLFPPMGVPAPYYFDLAEHFNQQQLQFACTDLRGHGPMHSDPSWKNNFGYYELITRDWPAAIRALKAKRPNAPIFLMGHSLGGQLSSCYLSQQAPDDQLKVDGLIMVASGSVYHKGYSHPLRVLLGTQFLH